MNQHPAIVFAFACALCLGVAGLSSAQLETKTQPTPEPAPIDNDLLDAEARKKIDQSVERGLAWLATQQQADGSFLSIESGQPAVTSFVLMAFLANGESPADGKYSAALSRAIDFIVSQQKKNGLLSSIARDTAPISRIRGAAEEYGHNAIIYNHAISSLALAETYGQCNEEQAEKITGVIERAITATLEMQNWQGKMPTEDGGWKYIAKEYGSDSDLSSTAWQIMFLRSAKNAGFDVPKESIDRAMKYVEACYDKKSGVFVYDSFSKKTKSRALAGAGVVALAHGGRHYTEQAQKSGDWILTRDFTKYNADKSIGNLTWQPDRFHYGVFHCSQAMYQLGGKHWSGFYPPVVETLLANQKDDGSWPAEKYDKRYGNCYSTSLCLLSLSIPNQLLPMFQR